MRRTKFLAVVLVASCALAGCSSLASTLRSATDENRNAPPSAAEAAHFGGVTLPQGVEVLGTNLESGQDTTYQLALRMNEAQLRELIDQFTAKPRPSEFPKSTSVIAGPALSSAPHPLYAHEKVPSVEHGEVNRELIVDERAPNEVYVHLSFFTT